ncbi:MAG: hypothetical protein E7337_13285 [Clostridiales bacterium]|nr:hypothetical protein [Clostridiales bacterium]
MKYTSRGLKRRGDSDKWHVTLSHKDPITGELVPSYHTVTARTEKQAMKRRDELILDLERKGGAYTSKLTVAEFLDKFIQYKQDTMAVERSTVNGYRKEARVICRYIGESWLADVDIPTVNRWMAQMVGEGYAPRTVAKAFAMLRHVKEMTGQDPDPRLLAVVEADHGNPANLGPIFAYLCTDEAKGISGEVFGFKSSGKIDRYAYPQPITHAAREAGTGYLWTVDELKDVFANTIMGEGYESHAAKRMWA